MKTEVELAVRLRKSILPGGPLKRSACKNTFIFAGGPFKWSVWKIWFLQADLKWSACKNHGKKKNLSLILILSTTHFPPPPLSLSTSATLSTPEILRCRLPSSPLLPLAPSSPQAQSLTRNHDDGTDGRDDDDNRDASGAAGSPPRSATTMELTTVTTQARGSAACSSLRSLQRWLPSSTTTTTVKLWIRHRPPSSTCDDDNDRDAPVPPAPLLDARQRRRRWSQRRWWPWCPGRADPPSARSGHVDPPPAGLREGRGGVGDKEERWRLGSSLSWLWPTAPTMTAATTKKLKWTCLSL